MQEKITASMAGKCGQQIVAIFCKNCMLNVRRYVVTTLIIALPVFLALFFKFVVHLPVDMRGLDALRKNHNATFFQPEDIAFPTKPYSYREEPRTTFRFFYVPRTPYAKKLFGQVIDKMKDGLWNGTIESEGFDSEEEMEVHIAKLLAKGTGSFTYDTVTAGVVMLNDEPRAGATPKSLKYKIRLEPDNFYYGRVENPYNERAAWQTIQEESDSYTSSCFLALQRLVEMTHLENVQKADTPPRSPLNIHVQLQRFPYPEYTIEHFAFLMLDMAPIIVVYGLLLLVPIFVKRIVEEKATGNKELLRLMGVRDWVYWTGTLLSNLVIILVIICLLVIIFCTTLVHFHTGFLSFVVLLFFAVQTILFCFALSTFFSRPTLAVLMTIIVWVLSHALVVGFMDPVWDPALMIKYPTSQKMATCILPPMSLHWAYKIMKLMEIRGGGPDWVNLTTSPFSHEHFSLGMVLGMMVASWIIYALITFYVDAVWPWQQGIIKPFYFPFTKSFWCGQASPRVEFCEMDGVVQNEYFEEETIGTSAGVVLSGLTKIFGIGPFQKMAVDSVSLKIARGQITALLGHNGAGKTTTLNMIAGILPPTQGSIRLNGYDVVSQTQQARDNLGLCPQEDLLFDQLTIKEHLQFYALVKGCPFRSVNSEVSRIMQTLNISVGSSQVAGKLSGGLQRKLSLAIAFIGGSKVLILDEPTAGLDPEGKRIVWEALKNLRENRTIILTTHSMEEADALADRIAIMSRGVIQCYGSPMFLRKKFGAGYYLRITKGPGCRANQVIDLIQRHLPSAQVENHTTTELVYSLGMKTSEKFGDLFEELEKREDDLGIAGYGVTVTTMDDVFLKASQIGEMVHGPDSNGCFKENDSSSLIDSGYANSIQAPKCTGFQKMLQIFRGLFMKRVHYTRRHWPFFVFLLVIPLSLFILLFIAKMAVVSAIVEEDFIMPVDISEIFGLTRTVCQTDDSIQVEPFVKGYQKAAGAKAATTTHVNDINKFMLELARNNMDAYKTEYLVGSTFEHWNNGTYYAKAWFNGEAHHTRPMSLNLVHTAFLKYLANDQNATFELILHPLPEPLETRQWYVYFLTRETGDGVGQLLIIMGMSFLASSFVLFPIHERAIKAKLLQMMAGINPLLFWGASFLWDFILHMGVSLLILIMIVICNSSNGVMFINTPSGAIFLHFLLHAWAAIPLAYLISFLTSSASNGIVIYNFIGVILGFISWVAVTIMEFDSTLMDSPWIRVFKLLPTVAFSTGYHAISSAAAHNSICEIIPKEHIDHLCPVASNTTFVYTCCKDHCGDDCTELINPLDWEAGSGAGQDAFMLFLDGMVFWIILYLLDGDLSKLWYRTKDFLRSKIPSLNLGAPQRLVSLTEDADVTEERHRAEDLASHDKSMCQDPLVVTNLTKKFGSRLVVDHLSFGVHKEECFGLLGNNGAGKTTMFRMLVGDLVLTEGDAVINGISLRENRSTFQSFVGYCPQEDSLLDRLTGREMMYLFARIRGIQEDRIARTVDTLVQMVGLESHADKLTRTYSGGMRRRLSVAMALIGSPPILFLDEPTSGVDPAARRKLWDTLNATKQLLGSSIILTSHSMDECEALCSRLTIVVNGQFQCFGGMQYLKKKFGQGFTVTIKLQPGQEDKEAHRRIHQFMQSALKDVFVKGEHEDIIHYHVTDMSTKVSHLFRTMERAKKELKLDDYLIADTSLEQIFLALARSQIHTNDWTAGGSCSKALSSLCLRIRTSNVLPCV